MVKDPICGMDVDSKIAKLKAEKDGKAYYFCSKNCYDKFTGEIKLQKSHEHQHQEAVK